MWGDSSQARQPRATRRRPLPWGMTLIEAVIAGALVVALGGTAVAVLLQYQAHYQASWTQMEDRRLAASALDGMERAVRSACRARILVSRTDPTVAASGTCLQLTTAGTTPAQDVIGHLYVASGGRLVLETPATTTTLGRNVTRLLFTGATSLVGIDLTVGSTPAIPYRLQSSVEVRG